MELENREKKRGEEGRGDNREKERQVRGKDREKQEGNSER